MSNTISSIYSLIVFKSFMSTFVKKFYIIYECYFEETLPIICKFFNYLSLGICVFYIEIVGYYLIIFLFQVGYNLTGNSNGFGLIKEIYPREFSYIIFNASLSIVKF